MEGEEEEEEMEGEEEEEELDGGIALRQIFPFGSLSDIGISTFDARSAPQGPHSAGVGEQLNN